MCALELAENNLKAFRAKLTAEDSINLAQGNAMDLSRYEDGSFDVVLLFGPLYHLHKEEDKQRCIAEAKRVCRPGGKIFFAFISHDFIILTEFSYRPDYFLVGDYDKETFELYDFPFVFHTVDECRRMLREAGVRVLHEIAADGVSELMEEQRLLENMKIMKIQSRKKHLQHAKHPEHSSFMVIVILLDSL